MTASRLEQNSILYLQQTSTKEYSVVVLRLLKTYKDNEQPPYLAYGSREARRGRSDQVQINHAMISRREE
uniref:Uncharacterized protein n=1 Tax=Angiostrongylus cantonensis TaxID=6313 RepID=A0A0K0DB57_ANGCA